MANCYFVLCKQLFHIQYVFSLILKPFHCCTTTVPDHTITVLQMQLWNVQTWLWKAHMKSQKTALETWVKIHESTYMHIYKLSISSEEAFCYFKRAICFIKMKPCSLLKKLIINFLVKLHESKHKHCSKQQRNLLQDTYCIVGGVGYICH